MKRLLMKVIPGALLLCLMSTPALAQNKDFKIGTVDIGLVFTNYFKTKQAMAALEDQKSEIAKSDKDMMDDYMKTKDAYQKLLADANNQALSESERAKRQSAAEDKLKDLKEKEGNISQFEQQARTRLGEQSARLRDNILSDIKDAVQSKSKAGGYTLVIDSSAQTADRTPVVLYSTAEDITDSVLAQLNAAAPATTPGSNSTKSSSGGLK